VSVQVRWFAAAAAAAGRASERYEETDLQGVLGAARARHGAELSRVLGLCSVLVDGERVDRDADLPLPAGSTLDVLPPFAGG
jgi:sulfur-carrier protein